MAVFSQGKLSITNYARIGHCSQDIIPSILQELLLSKEPTHQIQADCLSNRYLSRHLRADEWLLMNNAPINGYNSFDIPLIYKLLRNLNLVPLPTKGWDHSLPPAVNELTVGDDIERLRRKRNAILHRGNTIVSDTEMTDTFDIFKDIGNRLEIFLGKTNGDFVSKFQHIETCCMDEQSEKLFIEAMKNTALQEIENKEKIREVMEQTEKNKKQTAKNTAQIEKNKERTEKNTESIRQLTTRSQDRQRKIIQQWIQNDEKFITTECSIKLFNVLKANTVVTVVGNSGMGKTVTSRHVALKMIECGYDVYDVRSPLEILEKIVTDKKMLFVIDDICGKYNVTQHEVEEWERNMEYFESCLALKTIIILTTCRLQVFQSRQFKELQLLTSCRFNMLEKENEITVKEKRMIADSYTITKFSFQMSDEEIQQFDSFPLLCRMSAIFNDSVTEILSFMRNPFTVFEQEIDKMGIHRDRMVIAALGLMVIFNNELNECILKEDINDEQRKIFDDVFEACGEQRGSSRNRILCCLDTFEDVYIMKHDSCYRFLHTKIFDLFASYFGKKEMMLTAMLKYCNLSFLSERFWFRSLGTVTEESHIPLPVEKESIFLRRILDEVTNETLFDVFSCNLMETQEFRTRVILTLKQLGFEVVSRILKLSHLGMTILHIACKQGYRDLLLFFLNYSCPLDKCDYTGRTPLHVACRYENKDLVDMLLNAGVETNTYKMRGFTPLFEACLFGKTDVVGMLLRNGSDPNLHTKRLLIPLLPATEKGYTEIVKLLLSHNANVNKTNANDETALHLASKNGHSKVVRILIQNGADVNLISKYCENPLYFASIDPKRDLIELLLSANADITAISSQSQMSPVTLAIKNGRNDIARIMLQSIADSNAIYKFLEEACETGNAELMNIISDFDIDTNKVLQCGYTSLQIACKEDFLDIATILVENGADVNHWSEDAGTPTQLAVFFSNKDIVSFLVDNGADVNFSDRSSSKGVPPALHIACLQNEDEIVEILVENNADVNESALLTTDMIKKIRDADYIQQLCDKTGSLNSIAVFPLEIALFERNENIVDKLVSSGADINIKTTMGFLPLMISCFYQNIKITETLLEHKVNTNAVSDIAKLCMTNLHCRDKEDIIDMVAFYKRIGDVATTALHVATLLGSEQLVSMLLRHRCRSNIPCSINPVLIAVLTGKCDIATIDPYYVLAQFHTHKNIKDLLPIHLSCLVGNVEIFQLIFNSMQVYRTPVINVTANQLLCTQNVFVNPATNLHDKTYSFTPLQLAAMRHHWDICKILLKHGVEKVGVFEASSCLLDCLSDNEQTNNEFQYDLIICKTSIAHLAYENDQTELLYTIFGSGVDVDIGSDCELGTLFFLDCLNGRLDIVKYLYTRNADINIRNSIENGKTPLHVASGKNHLLLVEFLLSKDVIIDIADNDGNTPLHIACIHGFKKIANALLKKNAYKVAANKAGENAFHLCCKHNKTKCLSLLLNFVLAEDEYEYNELIHNTNIPTSVGMIPSYFAFVNDNKKMMKKLIAHGADINQRINDNGETLLFLACKENRMGWVRFLIKYSADINIRDIDNHSPIYMTCKSGFDEITSELLKHDVDVNRACNERCNPLYFCCLRNKSKAVEQLLLKKADPNALSNNMESLLIESCRNERKRIVELLLKHGADVNYCHYEGETALYFAFVAGNAAIMKILLDYNVSWNVCAHEREYYLYLACKQNMVDFIYLMMEYDNTINVNAIVVNGEAPFYMCCKHSSIKQVNFLIEFGGDVNMVINEKDTPFHQICLNNNIEKIEIVMQTGLVSRENIQREFIYFCGCNRMDIVDLIYKHYRQVLLDNSLEAAWFSAVNKCNINAIRLLAKEININIQGNKGRTALHIASSNGNENMVKELLSSDQIDVELKSHQGLSALHEACGKDNMKIVMMLLSKGADIGEKTAYGISSLMLACTGHTANIINCLFESSSKEVTQQFIEDANTILSKFYHISSMKQILRKIVCFVPKDTYISKGDKAIHFACRVNDPELLEFLLEHNHDVDSINEHGETPIMICIFTGNKKILEILLNANAFVKMVFKYNGETTLPSCFEDIEMTTISLNLFQYACLLDRIEITKTLLNLYDFDIDKPFPITPMLLSMIDYAESSCQMKCIMDIYGYRDHDNVAYITPLLYAALIQSHELVHILVERNADLNKCTTLSLLHVIALQKDIIQIILSTRNLSYLLNECTVNTLHILLLREEDYILKKLNISELFTIDSYATLTFLHIICFRGYSDHLKVIISQGDPIVRQFQILASHLAFMSNEFSFKFKSIRMCLSNDFYNCIRLSATEFACFIYDSCVLEQFFKYVLAQNTNDLLELSPALLAHIFGGFEDFASSMSIHNYHLKSNVSHIFLYVLLSSGTEGTQKVENEKDVLLEKHEISDLALLFCSGDMFEGYGYDYEDICGLLTHTIFELNLIQIIFVAANGKEWQINNELWDRMIMYDDLIRRTIKFDLCILGCIKDELMSDHFVFKRQPAMDFSPLELYYLCHNKIPDSLLESQKARTMTTIFTPLILACLHDNKSTVKLVLSADMSDVNTVVEPSSLHLMCFVDNLFFDIMSDRAVNHIASITALHIACMKQNDSFVNPLLRNNCDVNIPSILSPFHIAQLFNSDESLTVLKRYLETGPIRFGTMNALHITTFLDDYHIDDGLRSILRRVDCNLKTVAKLTSLHLYTLTDKDENTIPLRENNYNAYSELSALHITILRDKDDTLLALLIKGADIEQPAYVYPLHIDFEFCDNMSEMITEISVFSLTPLQLACISQNCSICEALIRKSSNINTNAFLFLEFQVSNEIIIHTYSSLSILLLAFLVHDIDIGRMILDLVTNVNEKSDISLWHICFFRPFRMLTLQNLVDKEVVLNIAPLHLASILNDKDYVIMLLDKDADVNVIGELSPLYVTLYTTDETEVSVNSHINGSQLVIRTPLHFAAEAGYIDVCEILLLYGADTEAETNVAGLHPWHLALYHGHINILRRLLSRPSKIEKAKFLFVLLLYIIRKR